MNTRGIDLKLARVGERIKQRQVGDAMGVSESRIAHIEALDVVPPRAAARYVKALEWCRTSRTSDSPVEAA